MSEAGKTSLFELVYDRMRRKIFGDEEHRPTDPCQAACDTSDEVDQLLPRDLFLTPSECYLIWEMIVEERRKK